MASIREKRDAIYFRSSCGAGDWSGSRAKKDSKATANRPGSRLEFVCVTSRARRFRCFSESRATERRKTRRGTDIDLKTGDIVQNSMVVPGRWWRVVQTADTVTQGSRDYNEKSRYAKTIRKDNATWGDVPKEDNQLAHRDNDMTCLACHSSWMTSCFGCHLSMQANRKMPNRHNEGGNTRNFTQYNFQVLRDDVFMLGRDGTVTGNRVAPVRSSSAVLVSSQNQNREWIYSQQQTTSAEGFAGQSFNTHVPHTVRARKRNSAATATCQPRTTTMPGWPNCFYRERTLSISWGATFMSQRPCAGSGGCNRARRAAGGDWQHAS